MLTGLYAASSAMDSLALQQEVIAGNLANASVPGYRGRIMTFAPVDIQETPQGYLPKQGTQVNEIAMDFTQGMLQQSNRALDVALSGPGFFEIEGPNGPLYTRNGTFHVDDTGKLVTLEGRSVVGTSGDIKLTVPVGEYNVQINQQGDVYSNGQQVGKLKIVNFEDPKLLTTAGTTLFQAPPEAATIEFKGEVLQGFREASNVSAVSELIRMIAGMRQFEAAQRAIRSMDNALTQRTQNA